MIFTIEVKKMMSQIGFHCIGQCSCHH